MAHVTHTMIDHSGEQSFTRHLLPDLTGANYAVITGNTAPTQNVGALRVALGNISDMNFVRHTVTAVSVRTAPVTSVQEAQRESKLLVRSIDNINARRFNVEIPAPKLSILAQPNTDLVDTTAPEWTDLVDMLEAETRSPWGNQYTVVDGRLVGRRL